MVGPTSYAEVVSGRPVVVGLALALTAGAGCGSGSPASVAAAATAAPAVEPTLAPVPTAAPSPSPTPEPTATPAPTATATPEPEPAWELEVREIDDAIRARVEPTSWRPGCPVGLDDLRLLTFPHHGFDGGIHRGELIVAAEWTDAVGRVFEQLFDASYPVERIRLVDEYGGDDGASMRANNTSGFNCREVAGRPGVWSNHAFGTAIDLNPLMNPYVRGSVVDPPEGAAYVDRGSVRPGMIVEGDAAVAAFGDIGWVWGGHWRSSKDYQHFSADGR